MKLYLSTGFGNRAAVERAARLATDAGHEITYRWWHHEPDDFMMPSDRKAISRREWEAITAADAVIVILPGGRGTHVELGLALAELKPVALVGDGVDRMVNGELCGFHDLAHYQSSSIEDALRWVAEIAR